MKNWLYSKKNLVACAVASVGIILYLVGVIDEFWYLIVAGMYALTYFAVPSEKTPRALHIDAFSLSEYSSVIDSLLKTHKDKMPRSAIEKLLAIESNTDDLIEFLNKEASPLLNEQTLALERIFTHYLPSLVNNYTKLPTRYAENSIIKNGKTTKDYFIEQLSILDEQVKKTADAIYENDAKSFLIYNTVLKEKFNDYKMFEIKEEEKEINA